MAGGAVKIPSYSPQVQTPSGASAPSPVAHARQALYNPDLSGLAKGVQDVATVLSRQEEEHARAWSADAVSQARLDWTTQLMDRQATADPGAPEFTPGLLKDFDEYKNKSLENAPTAIAKRYLNQRLDALRGEIGDKAVMFEAKARADWRADKFDSAIQNTEKLMNTDPSQFNVALAEQLAVIDSAALAPVQKSAMRQKAIDKISAAAVWSQIQKSPSDFLDSIGFYSDGKTRKSSGDLTGKTGNAAFDTMPFERRVQMFSEAVKQKAVIDADADRAATKATQLAAADAEKTLWGKFFDGKLKRVDVENVRAILPVASYHSILKALEKPEGGAKSDPGTYASIERLINDNKFEEAQKAAFTAQKNGMLSNEHLTSMVTRARTQDRQEGPKTQYERSYKYITTAMDPGPLIKDAVGRSRMAEAIRDFDSFVMGDGQKKPTDAEIDKYAIELVPRYKLIDLQETLLGLPQPRSGTITRDVVKAPADLKRVTAEVVRKFDNKMLSQKEYNDEMALLNRFRKALDQK